MQAKILRFHLNFFQMLGYFPLSFRSQQTFTCSEKLRLLWPLIPLSLFTILTSFVFFSDEDFRLSDNAFGYFNDTLKVSLAQISMTCFFLESLIRRGVQRKFWRCYFLLQRGKTMEEHLTPFQRLRQEFRENFRFLSINYGIFGLEVVFIVLFSVCRRNMTHHLVLFWSMFTPFVWFLHFRNMQVILHVELLRQELVQLRLDLADYTKFITRVRPFEGYEEFLRRKILEKQKIYEIIYEMYECFQKSFGFSIMFIMLMVYVRVLVDVYFTFYSIYFDMSPYETFLLIPSLCEIPAYLLVSKTCMDVIKFITFEIHNIITPIDDMRLSLQIQNFSLQLLHQKIVINGIGIATMDGYLLAKIVGSITMYMIFFIQFMPKFGQH